MEPVFFLALITLLYVLALTRFFPQTLLYRIISTMVEATAADGKMKDLKISEVKKKKDGNPQKAAKKPQQQKKKVRYTWKP
jgi:hypothetical protein